MGLKRKASFDDSSVMLSSPPQSLPPSSQSSSTSTVSNHVDRPLNLWNIAGAPYFNSRTRKRFRDSRPDEETIHQNTLSMLFNAQKRSHKSAMAVQDHDRSPSSPSIQPGSSPNYAAAGGTISGPASLVEVPRDRNQRSLDGFFSSSFSPRHAQDVGPRVEQVAQPQEYVAHLTPEQLCPPPSALACEDCDAPLLTRTTGEAVDAEMLDVDGPVYMDPDIHEGWSCSVCTKRVCDVRAVRGDYRVCLDCVVPGGRRYRQEEIQEKRWVGGIGWM